MTIPSIIAGQRLRAVLRQSARVTNPEDAPEGAYSPASNARDLSLGRDSTALAAQMVSHHESFHALLNASTTYGTCMIAAGSLAEAECPGFAELTERLIARALTTHETYATLTSIYVATRGRMDASLLEPYPSYRPIFDAFARAYDIIERPFVGTICLDACARAAMQTEMAGRWAALPCQAWLEFRPDGLDNPDIRFSLLLERRLAAQVEAAVDTALREAGGVIARLAEPMDTLEAMAMAIAAPNEVQEGLQRAAYAAVAKALAGHGAATAGFEDARRYAPRIVKAVEAVAGERLNRAFHIPKDQVEDRESALLDFRRERLSLRPGRDAAIVVSSADLHGELGDLFLGSPANPYLQLIAMPIAKAKALYRLRVGSELVDAIDGDVVALRRRLAPAPAYPEGLVMMAVLDDPQALAEALGRLGDPQIKAVVSATSFDDGFVARWLERPAPRLDALGVVIDRDPFEYLAELSSDRPLELRQIAFDWGNAANPTRTNVTVVTDPARPARVYFAPSSGPLFDAISVRARRTMPNLSHGGEILPSLGQVLLPVLSHALNEESRFGFDFWYGDQSSPVDL